MNKTRKMTKDPLGKGNPAKKIPTKLDRQTKAAKNTTFEALVILIEQKTMEIEKNNREQETMNTIYLKKRGRVMKERLDLKQILAIKKGKMRSRARS